MENNKGEEASSRGNGWEVVSLTASTYSAADDRGSGFGQYDEETARAMFMSDHFVFPPSEHENLPLETDNNEIDIETKDVGVSSYGVQRFDMNKSDKENVENCNVKELRVPDEFPGIQFFDEKGNRLSVRGEEFEEDMGLQGPNLVGEEKSMFNSTKFSSLNSEADSSGPTVNDELAAVTESCDPSHRILDSCSDFSKSINHTKEVQFNKSGLPCEAWWKKRVASLYTNTKEVNAFWSIFVAATLVGLVFLGRRWQKNKVAGSAT
ncbi:ATG8-interacting protein 1-like [Macadamia integrifolia]|uniref:ATG8-interacting protein 1-like n=1 Tax=Macadamia integrifolia TaxID=60698 RepID=UPI001C4F9D0D|nr:ATG8-interacting protein 1-like [Macadamia integrifolia]XP_042506926.1 ATG8-interacting protein 1-like [Macadamia integrifolia]XP_042506927.1 ATG8-interacting protein 1-like [Macadamia integrifolia]XP_042506928.1 ATG8-interacting protein 1-like [Macadamia integrifolia]